MNIVLQILIRLINCNTSEKCLLNQVVDIFTQGLSLAMETQWARMAYSSLAACLNLRQ